MVPIWFFRLGWTASPLGVLLPTSEVRTAFKGVLELVGFQTGEYHSVAGVDGFGIAAVDPPLKKRMQNLGEHFLWKRGEFCALFGRDGQHIAASAHAFEQLEPLLRFLSAHRTPPDSCVAAKWRSGCSCVARSVKNAQNESAKTGAKPLCAGGWMWQRKPLTRGFWRIPGFHSVAGSGIVPGVAKTQFAQTQGEEVGFVMPAPPFRSRLWKQHNALWKPRQVSLSHYCSDVRR